MPQSGLISTLALGLGIFAPAFSHGVANLCEENEQTFWSCVVPPKIYSLCGPKEWSQKSGYLQYRTGTSASIDFRFPETQQSPAENFIFRLFNTTAAVQFNHQGYEYSIYESINAEASIEVVKDGKRVGEIQCSDSSDTLTLTSTMEEFKVMGIYR